MLVTDEVSAKARSQLALFYTSIVPVATIRGTSTANLALIGRPDLHATLTKLSLWELTQYDRVVYLDADTLVLADLGTYKRSLLFRTTGSCEYEARASSTRALLQYPRGAVPQPVPPAVS